MIKGLSIALCPTPERLKLFAADERLYAEDCKNRGDYQGFQILKQSAETATSLAVKLKRQAT